MDEEPDEQFFEIALNNGNTVQCAVRPNETMKEFAQRLKETTGVIIGISEAVIDGKSFDENTDVLSYFSANIKPEEEEEVDAMGDGEGHSEYMEYEAVAGLKTETDTAGGDLVGLFCSVPGCGSNKLDYPDLAMFQLPSNRNRCLEWLAAISREDMADQSVEQLSRELCVCANHFIASQFADKIRQTLRDSAVPSLFLNTQVDEGGSEEKVDEEDDNQFVREYSEETQTAADEKTEEDLTHPGSLCRLCASPMDTCPVYIFGAEQEDISDMINACLPVSVTKEDVLPKQICQVCHQRLQLQHSFAEACIEAEKKLAALTRRFLVMDIKKTRGNKNKQMHCCPLCCHGGMEVQAGDAQLTNEVDDDKNGNETAEDLYSDEDAEADEGVEAEDSVAVNETTTAGEQRMTESPMDLLYLPEDRNFVFECDICEEAFASAVTCQNHCKGHALPDYYPCVVCGLVFASDELFDNHFFNHKLNKPTTPKRAATRTSLACATCGFQANTRKDFILHTCSQPVVINSPARGSGVRSCDQCSHISTTAARAEAHKAVHTENGEAKVFLCGQCSESMSTDKMLQHHIAVVHDDIKHECSECGLRFIAARHLELHSKIHNSGCVQYQCSMCSRLFPTLASITVHIQSHVNKNEKEKPKLQCGKCGNHFAQRSQLERHLESAHDSMGRMPSLIQYQCNVCSQRIKTSAEVLVHRTLHWKVTDPRLPFVCEYCGEGHQSPNSLARHRRYLHPEEHPYVCTLCDEATRTLYEARVHRKTHTGYVAAPPKPQPKIYQCDQCPSLFSDRAVFLTHKKNHKTAQWFMCDLCDKAFPDKTRLVVHRRWHTGEKPYACGTCGKRFAQTSAMYSHALLHTGETPHACDICDRKFRIKADRDSHRRTHTGEKPYKCQYCSKSFRTGQVYYQHRMIHTDDRRFRCDICGRGFKRSHTLVCHRRIHTGEKPNICDICGKGFRQRTDMRKHKMNLHNVSA